VILNIVTIDSRKAAAGLLTLAALLAASAVALHWPGHVSMDTSIQLYEASIGKSAGWQPPFTAALMKWLGGGEAATGRIVLLCSLLTYGSLGYVAAAVLRNRSARGDHRIAAWRVALCALLLLNPVIFVYVGIVWKDVLFASVLTVAVALSLTAALRPLRRGLVLSLAAVLLLAIGMQVRQQGLFMAPVLLVLPVAAMVSSRGWSRSRQVVGAIALASVFLASLVLTKTLVADAITGAGDKSIVVGFRSIMHFDIAGTVARSGTATEALPVRISAEQRAAVRRVYSSRKIDFLATDSVAWAWLEAFTDEQRREAWWALVRHEPAAFLGHKWEAYRNLLDLSGLQGCLPFHVGVEGNREYLRSVGIAQGRDGRDLLVYLLASVFLSWSLYRHWFYVLALLGAAAAMAAVTLPPRLKTMCAVAALASALLYLSFMPTAIACDFRYLYPGIPLVTMLWIVLLAGGSARQSPPSAAPKVNSAPSP
jgi:hypothetical protein